MKEKEIKLSLNKIKISELNELTKRQIKGGYTISQDASICYACTTIPQTGQAC